eukprot:RCo036627
MAMFPNGSHVYFLSGDAWCKGTVMETLPGGKLRVRAQAAKASEAQVVHAAEVHPEEPAFDGSTEDLLLLPQISDAALLHSLQLRFEAPLRLSYTHIGPQGLLFLNPHHKMPFDSPAAMQDHIQRRTSQPHSWQFAHRAYENLILHGKRNQSIVISGESGAGKTETAKLLVEYLCELSLAHAHSGMQRGDLDRIHAALRHSIPLLEGFGNAKTVHNENSSRFGKLTRLLFHGRSGVLMAAQVQTYLLEKSRVVRHNPGERNYHIFYQFVAGLSADQRRLYGDIARVQDYRCLFMGGVAERRDPDDGRQM